ncbi:hypothetical protein [Ornithinibacillus xuwenensis]|uniref:Uncharacterized protein n=1 Tax=Ornithinibacillus xuwenensis TaxID=3144668 RepID=A0ABU9XJH9_9BACI
MINEKERIKAHLNNELKHTHFTKQQDVLKRVYPHTWKQKIVTLWNKEIQIPIIPITALFVLVMVSVGSLENSPTDSIDEHNKERVLVDIAGNYYWEDEFERALLKHEN